MLLRKNCRRAAIFLLLAVLAIHAGGCGYRSNRQSAPSAALESESGQDGIYRAIAYVTVPASDNWRWIGSAASEGREPVSEVDTLYVTHINFAFGMLKAYQFEADRPGSPLKDGDIVSREAYKDPADGQYHYKAVLEGWIEEMGTKVDGRGYLKALVDLKKQKPDLKVLLSIGGWDSDGFCYMARSPEGRAEFIQSGIDLMKEYHLDGIDLDWEYPTNGGWNEIACCKDCESDARTLLKEFRDALDKAFAGEHKLLTIASGCSQPWVDKEAMEALDYINVMCYDYAPGSGKDMAGLDAAKGYMKAHAGMVGNTPENRKKINLGIPFYNEGGPHLVPYYKGWSGHVDASAAITREKMNWVREEGYGGAFYWAYSMDTFEQDTETKDDPEIKILQRTVYETLNGSAKESK